MLRKYCCRIVTVNIWLHPSQREIVRESFLLFLLFTENYKPCFYLSSSWFFYSKMRHSCSAEMKVTCSCSLLCKSTYFCIVFFSFPPDGSPKHVILFENMEEALVTIGFVWWQLLNTPSASPGDTSNISMMLIHLQGRSTPCPPSHPPRP